MSRAIKMTSYILVIVGALNWGLVGVLDFDLVAKLFGDMTFLSRLVYSLVGVGGVITLLTSKSYFMND